MAAPSLPASAAEFLPAHRTIASLAKAARQCQGCPLYDRATQTVFGEGPTGARAIFVGEQPGDVEDRQGRPFVGPAGKLFDKMLAEAGIDRSDIYVTNAVKHFKWTPRGKRRLHAKPTSREIMACRPWLEEEIAALAAPMLILLGATAAQSLLGRGFSLTKRRGQPFESPWAAWTLATYHPSALLRAQQFPGAEARQKDFNADMRLVAAELARRP
jgi:uracil-DNA glycosylase family protein